MKAARTGAVLLLGACCPADVVGTALLRRRARGGAPSMDDQLLNKDVSEFDQFMQAQQHAPDAADSSQGGSINDLLTSAKWPPREQWDQALGTVLSGAQADPCSAPLLARARLSPYGFGAHLNQFANEVALAMYSGQPIALCAPSNVRDNWDHYFQDPGFARCDKCDWNVGPRRYKEMGMDISDGHDQAIAADLKRYLYRKLFTMKYDQQQPIDAGLQDLDAQGLSGGSYVGVHIRRGDKSQEVELVPIQKFAATVRDLCSRIGTSTVFLASDDETVHGELQQELGSDYKVLEQPRLPADVYQLRGDAARSTTPGYGVEDEEKSVLVDVTALVRSQAFVGTASSNIDRLVYFERSPDSTSVSMDAGGNGFLSMT